jgi:hypothetical protein
VFTRFPAPVLSQPVSLSRIHAAPPAEVSVPRMGLVYLRDDPGASTLTTTRPVSIDVGVDRLDVHRTPPQTRGSRPPSPAEYVHTPTAPTSRQRKTAYASAGFTTSCRRSFLPEVCADATRPPCRPSPTSPLTADARSACLRRSRLAVPPGGGQAWRAPAPAGGLLLPVSLVGEIRRSPTFTSTAVMPSRQSDRAWQPARVTPCLTRAHPSLGV